GPRGLGFRIGMGATMDRILGRLLVSLAVLIPATLAVLHAAGIPQPTTLCSHEDAWGSSVFPTPDDGADKTPKRKDLLIIGASSLISPDFALKSGGEPDSLASGSGGKGTGTRTGER